MFAVLLALGASVLGQDADLEPAHAANPIYAKLLGEGVALDMKPVRLPAPILRDGQTADDQRAALRKIAGSDGAVQDLLRESVTAPQILRVHDDNSGGKIIVRRADLWFVVYADLDALDPDSSARKAEQSGPVEAGNMRVETHILTAEELKSHGVSIAASKDGQHEWYTHVTGRLLDRIHVEATNRTFATRSADSVVIATEPASSFEKDPKFSSRWWPIVSHGGREEAGASQPYPGGVSYVKISRLTVKPGALLVEAHFAFAEPQAWFDGAPILRSKIGVVAQDQIRRLRRELADQKRKKREG